jgi:hypothetical protein
MAATDESFVEELKSGSRSDAPRRHRWLTSSSGFTLLACLILPLFPFCHGSLPPLIAPPICWPYYIGFLIAIAALTQPYALRMLSLVIRGVIAGFALGWCVMLAGAATATATLAIVGSAIVAMVSLWPGSHERVIARSGVAVGTAAIMWFASLIEYDDVLIGAYVGLVASIALAIGCAWWWLEAYADSR